MDIHATLRELAADRPLSAAEAEAVFEAILTGRLDDAQIAAVLALIARRGPTVDELVGGARVMRRHVTRVPIDPDPSIPLLDTCGTGGAPKTFNVSTAAAIAAAAAAPHQLRIAKHGSVSRTGRGSAEVMQHLGVNTAASPHVQARCLREIGVCFCFSLHHHPAMKHAAGPRKSLGFPTIFNLLGPLTNPAGARRQLMGCYSRDLALKVAHTLARLGVDHAMVCTSHDGLDELTTTDTTLVHHVAGGVVTAQVIDAADFGLPRRTIADLQAQTLEDSAALIRAILAPSASRSATAAGSLSATTIAAARDMVLLSSAAALVVADLAPTIPEGIDTSYRAIESGAAHRTLDALARLTNE